MHKIAVGIDLGTTYSAVAVFQNESSETIINGLGNRLTPSCVAFTPLERIVGEGAVYKAANNPENTIYGVKRLMGRNFTDKAIEKDIKSWPFKVMEENNQIKIEVQYKNERKRYFPEEISAAILENLKNTAEVYLGVKIKDVVITCPAYFDNSQKEATMDAAKIAGLHVLRLINEPTAAAIAYGLHVKNSERKTALIFDFGGGTFDVSILTIKGKDFSVRATNGDTHLGGEDFDMLMVNYFVTQFKRKHKQDISENKGLMSQLKSHCERAKRILSTAKEVDIQLEGTKLTGTISRVLFEDLIEDLCERAIKLVGDALIKAKVTKNEIDDVVMVGGSSRIPLIKKKLSDFFDGKQLCHKLNMDEAVAEGAAIQAAMLQGQLNGLKLRDVCPLPLGTKVADGSVSVIIEGNSPIPAKASQTFITAHDMQLCASIEIYEGERTMAEDNHFLGEFVVDGIPPMARHKGEIENIYEIDENGILKVTAVTAGSSKSLTITNKSRLSKDDAKRLAKEAAQFRAEDAMHKARLEAYNAFDYYLYDITRKMSSLLSEAKQKKAKAFIDDFSKWMDENPKATKEEFEEKQFNLEQKWNDV